MWLTLSIGCLSWLLCDASWYPLSSMLGEQVDLVGATNDSFVPEWTRGVNDGLKDPVDSSDWVNSTEFPLNSVHRDREPLDEVERIEPKLWPDVLLTRSASPSTTERSLSRNPIHSPSFAQRNLSTQSVSFPENYPALTAPTPTASVDEVFCDFGAFPTPMFCEWQNGNGALDWTAGTGLGTNWMGGPPSDSTTGTMEGGYAFVEASQVSLKDVKFQTPGGLMHSPQLGSTGVTGTCIMFKYAMDGLSIGTLRLLLHVGVDEYSIKKEQTEEILPDNVTVTSCKPGTLQENRVVWHAQYFVLGVWQQAQILYTYPDLHSLVVEGLPVDTADPTRLYRGYIAIDDIDLQPGTSCIGFCNFAGGFCDWNNDAEDDFDWTISRGSGNPTTGPVIDSSNDRSTAGGYAFIDSAFPRRPGDKSRLISSSFPATSADSPMCMHFWFHMFGSGIGSLKLFLRHFRSLDTPLREIWGLSGNAGNAWFVAQITIGSLDDFQLVFEASVGNTGMGDIAIDDISFAPGTCPILPQVAATIPRDCTFEVDECDWHNSRDPDLVAWERISSQTLSPRNQRKPYSNGYTINRRNEYFLGLGRPREGLRSAGGGTAQLISREMKGSEEPLCISFWYLMFEPFIDSAGPSLGVLRVFVRSVGETSEGSRPIWQLYNNQGPNWNYAQANINERRDFEIVLQGIWGPNRASGIIGIDDISFYTGNCTVKPTSASVRAEDCSFENGLCGWENITSPDAWPAVSWQLAFVGHRPAQLLDRTFGATGEFIFFDIFRPNKNSSDVKLRSPVIEPSGEEDSVCFTFWFAAFGVEEYTTLQVIKVSVEEDEKENAESGEDKEMQPLWSLTAKGFINPRPVWIPAQVTIENRVPYRLILKGSASNGGFAIDDIKFQPQSCATRPPAAQSTNNGT